jgi:hypothetical protein
VAGTHDREGFWRGCCSASDWDQWGWRCYWGAGGWIGGDGVAAGAQVTGIGRDGV